MTDLPKKGILQIVTSGRRKAVLKVLVSGDFCPLDRTEKLVLNGSDGEVFADYRSVSRRADIAVTNLEAPLTRAKSPILKTGPNLKVDPKCVRLLKSGGFNVVTMANNHIGDFGTRPVRQTLDILKANGLPSVGAGINLEDARKPLRITRKGIRISILNYAENEFGGALPGKAGASTLDPLINMGEIRESAASSDIVLVFIHGGNEGNPLPSPRMQQTYRAFVDAGASAVIGAHTHCPQGIEIWRNAPIIYSLGNLIFDRSFIIPDYDPTDFWWVGYSAMLSFDRTGALELEVIPHTFGPDARAVRLLTGRAHTLFCQYLARISKMILEPKAMVRHWEGWCAGMGSAFTPYFSKLAFPLKNRKRMWNAMVVRNTYTCETHHETLATFFRLIEEGRLDTAKKHWPRVAALAKAPAKLAALLARETLNVAE